MNILAIDPGPKESAYCIWDGHRLGLHSTVPNDWMLLIVLGARDLYACDHIVIEWITGYGLTVGMETFETCRWVGRFEQAAGGAMLITRKEIKSHLCGNIQAKDQHVRQALIERIGPPGTKKKPGPTYGIIGHEWSALSVALTWLDKYQEAE